MLWQTGTTGDGAASGYSEAETIGLFERLFLDDNTQEGVLTKYGSRLDATPHSGGAPTVDVAAGAGMVRGFHYWNTAVKNLAITKPGVGDTGMRVILRASGGTVREIRLAVKMNADGNNAIPAVTQDAGFPSGGSTVWEIALFQGVVDTAGGIWTDSGKGSAGLTDERDYVAPHVFRRQGADLLNWTAQGVVDYRPGHSMVQVGTTSVVGDGAATYETVRVTFPMSFAPATPIVLAQVYGAAGMDEHVVMVSDVSATYVDLRVERTDGAALVLAQQPFVFWMAVGPG